ncbi:peptide chain release factor N(5)-glutamine methyltransferase [Anaerosinus massiliensis]|uniref:peptide chain release factor N(5)-glutamine methyltransferase n=1 Tax=Massilibacillus massiliensis TaxID=1806837 RepID=UPI000ACC1EA4|nr:peptide chain release factor N(5)-glutamine methyltransferase [Massilibacillus massiliensis]
MEKPNEVWTIGSILKWTGQYFADKGVESPRLDAEVLLSHVLGKERIYLYVHFDEPLQAEELSRYKAMIKKRVARMPVAYIIGYKEFMGLSFEVSPAVLIPRPDTEILVEAVIERLKDRGKVDFVDIGTGSGAIVLSLLANLPQAVGSTVDISEEAIQIAKRNAEKIGVQDRVTFFHGDVYSPIRGQVFDVIVSNPPYIPDGDIQGLTAEVKCEPHHALAGGIDGLDFYRRLIGGGLDLLKPGGFMAFEVGIHQAAAVAELAKNFSAFGEAIILKDYGGIERVVILDKV